MQSPRIKKFIENLESFGFRALQKEYLYPERQYAVNQVPVVSKLMGKSVSIPSLTSHSLDAKPDNDPVKSAFVAFRQNRKNPDVLLTAQQQAMARGLIGVESILATAAQRSKAIAEEEQREIEHLNQQQGLSPEDKTARLQDIEHRFNEKRATLKAEIDPLIKKQKEELDHILNTSPNSEKFKQELELVIGNLQALTNSIIFSSSKEQFEAGEKLDKIDAEMRKGSVDKPEQDGTHYYTPTSKLAIMGKPIFSSPTNFLIVRGKDGKELEFPSLDNDEKINFAVANIVKTYPDKSVTLKCSQRLMNNTSKVAQGLIKNHGFKPQDIALEIKDPKTGKIEYTTYAEYDKSFSAPYLTPKTPEEKTRELTSQTKNLEEQAAKFSPSSPTVFNPSASPTEKLNALMADMQHVAQSVPADIAEQANSCQLDRVVANPTVAAQVLIENEKNYNYRALLQVPDVAIEQSTVLIGAGLKENATPKEIQTAREEGEAIIDLLNQNGFPPDSELYKAAQGIVQELSKQPPDKIKAQPFLQKLSNNKKALAIQLTPSILKINKGLRNNATDKERAEALKEIDAIIVVLQNAGLPPNSPILVAVETLDKAIRQNDILQARSLFQQFINILNLSNNLQQKILNNSPKEFLSVVEAIDHTIPNFNTAAALLIELRSFATSAEYHAAKAKVMNDPVLKQDPMLMKGIQEFDRKGNFNKLKQVIFNIHNKLITCDALCNPQNIQQAIILLSELHTVKNDQQYRDARAKVMNDPVLNQNPALMAHIQEFDKSGISGNFDKVKQVIVDTINNLAILQNNPSIKITLSLLDNLSKVSSKAEYDSVKDEIMRDPIFRQYPSLIQDIENYNKTPSLENLHNLQSTAIQIINFLTTSAGNQLKATLASQFISNSSQQDIAQLLAHVRQNHDPNTEHLIMMELAKYPDKQEQVRAHIAIDRLLLVWNNALLEHDKDHNFHDQLEHNHTNIEQVKARLKLLEQMANKPHLSPKELENIAHIDRQYGNGGVINDPGHNPDQAVALLNGFVQLSDESQQHAHVAAPSLM